MKLRHLFPTLFLLLGCSVKEERTVEKLVEKPTTYNGPSDTGGGNGINGRPIESYAIALWREKLFQDLIMPMIRKITPLHKELAGDMYHVALDRKWYFVPVELAKIPSQLIGAHSETEQLALQSYKELWLDDIKFKEMDEDSKVSLIVHELVMGVRLLQYQSRLEICLAVAARELVEPDQTEDQRAASERNYSNLRGNCYSNYGGFPPSIEQKPIVLSKEDYVEIRELTVLIMDNLSNTSQVELESHYKLLNRRYGP
jgi:hypothetical protein